MRIQEIKNIVLRHGTERHKLMPILQELVSKYNYLDHEIITEVAKEMKLSSADVYGTASFYSFLETKPVGRHVIRLCRTIVCDMKEKSLLLKALEDHLGIKLGETTKDNRFSLLETNCLGHCHEGPVLLVGDDVYTKVDGNSFKSILKKYE